MAVITIMVHLALCVCEHQPLLVVHVVCSPLAHCYDFGYQFTRLSNLHLSKPFYYSLRQSDSILILVFFGSCANFQTENILDICIVNLFTQYKSLQLEIENF